MESLLSFAEELERRDADVAQALTGVERLQSDVEELRAHAAAAAAFLDALPAALAERAADERDAIDARDHAEQAVRAAEQLVERLEAERALQQARDDLHAAEFWVAQTREAHAELERNGVAARERDEVVREATELLASVLGDPQTATAVAGVREQVARALGEPSS